MNFTIYSRDMCGYCEKVKEVMDLTKQEYVVYNLGEHFDRDSFKEEFGQRATFPQVLVDGKKIGGCSDTIEFLRENKIA